MTSSSSPSPPPPRFAPRRDVAQVEEGAELAPRADALMVGVATDAVSGEVLMAGFLNPEALRLCVSTGMMHWWSRSRSKVWCKGETSGMTQRIVELRVDDDQDAVWARVEVGGAGASCHVGYRSCFFRRIDGVGGGWSDPVRLTALETRKLFDPDAVYGDAPNPTRV